MMVVLIAGLIVSILWNKGLLPHTKYVAKWLIDLCSCLILGTKSNNKIC